jgi:hypothetical protein
LPTQHNISQVVTLLTTGRFTASLEAQLQPTQMDASTLKCTLHICAGLTLCGAAKNIGTSWSTFMLKIQLRAREPQTISFVTSCSTPAYVAIRNLVIPGQITGVATFTAVQTASAVTSTVFSVETGNAALGLSGSIIANSCQETWITIYGDDDFEHIPPKGVAIVPTDPKQRFGAGVTIQSLAVDSTFCVQPSSSRFVDCAYGLITKRHTRPSIDSEPPQHPTHPLYINDKYVSIDGLTFAENEIIDVYCTWERHGVYTDQQSIISISNTGCDGVSFSGVLLNDGNDVSMAYAGNTAAKVSIRYPARLELQTWSRNEPGWVQGTYSSVDGASLVNSAYIVYTIEDEQPHSFEFVCNFTTRSPSGAMTQVVYSTSLLTTTETTTATDFISTTETATETSTETTTKFSTTAEYATSTCAVETSTDTSTTSSEAPPDPTPDNPPSPAPRENWSVTVVDRCLQQPSWAVIATQPQVAVDTMLFTYWNSAGLSIVSDDANPTFFPVSGGTLCAVSSQTGIQWCGVETVTTNLISNGDTLTFTCPAPAKPPDMSNTIPLQINSNVNPSPAPCSYFAYQIGCEPGNFCLGRGYENNQRENDNLALQYPVLSPGARLRVRQTDVARTEWRVSVTDPTAGYSVVYTQLQGNWLEISVPSTAASIALEASCYYY